LEPVIDEHAGPVNSFKNLTLEGTVTSFKILPYSIPPPVLTNSEGAMVAQFSYGPWGEVTRLDPGSFTAEFGFAGVYYHEPSGLNITLSCAYHPSLGRWLSRDPLGENSYSYCDGDPINCVDPWGLWPLMLTPFMSEDEGAGKISRFMARNFKEYADPASGQPNALAAKHGQDIAHAFNDADVVNWAFKKGVNLGKLISLGKKYKKSMQAYNKAQCEGRGVPTQSQQAIIDATAGQVDELANQINSQILPGNLQNLSAGEQQVAKGILKKLPLEDQPMLRGLLNIR
jgi:RHS repeat-associated protein